MNVTYHIHNAGSRNSFLDNAVCGMGVGNINDGGNDEDQENNSCNLIIYSCPQQCTTSASDVFTEDDSCKSEVPISASNPRDSCFLHLSNVSSLSSNIIFSSYSSMVPGIQEQRVSITISIQYTSIIKTLGNN